MIFLLMHLLSYIIAIVIACILCARSVRAGNSSGVVVLILSIFSIANLALLMVYIPLVLFNPYINWKLAGGTGHDPYYLLIYMPSLFFALAVIVTLSITFIAGIFGKFARKDLTQ